jgi:hypothetical protein
LADNQVNDHTRRLLLDADGKGGFEKVLSDLEASADPEDKKRHAILISALGGMFNFLNGSFARFCGVGHADGFAEKSPNRQNPLDYFYNVI